MREIKFRVWDKVDEKYLWLFTSNVINSILGQSHSDKPISERTGRIFARMEGDYIMQQYTGLKDKNGKEIYEGDIIANHFFDVNVAVQWDVRFAQFTFGGAEFNVECNPNDVTILGNIYETPDLLTTKN